MIVITATKFNIPNLRVTEHSKIDSSKVVEQELFKHDTIYFDPETEQGSYMALRDRAKEARRDSEARSGDNQQLRIR